MNCQTCRQHLEPFLDDELSVNENVSVLDHVTMCAACKEVFDVERRIRKTLRERLSRDGCPGTVAARAFAAIRAEARPRRILRAAAWVIPAAAAVVLAFLVPVFLEGRAKATPHPSARVEPRRSAFAAERTHDHVMHGAFLNWAGSHYDELAVDLKPDEVLTREALRRVEPRNRSLAALAEYENVVKAKLGRDFMLPAGFVEGGRVVGGELLDWHEGLVQQVIVEYGDRELSLFEISCCHAKRLGSEITQLVASLHTVESDPGRQVSISYCRGCDAVLVLRNNRTYLLISRQGRDWDDEWMLDRARKLLD